MGCAGSSEGNTKHGQSGTKRAKPAGPRRLSGQAVSMQSSDQFQSVGVGPQQDGGDAMAGGAGGDGNENSTSFGARSNESQSAKNPLTPGSRPRDDTAFGFGGGGGGGAARPTSQQGGSRPMSRGVAKPHGARRSSTNNPAGHGSLAPTISPSNRRRSSAVNSINDIPRASIDGSMDGSDNPPPNGNTGAATFAFRNDDKAGAAAVTALPFHPRSRILPRKFNSRHDRSYKGMYRNKEHSDWEILTQKRILAQDKELENDDCAEAKGLAWPIVGTNWKFLKFASQDHHVADDLQSGNEADDDLVPLCALRDLPPADRDSEYLNGLRIKRTREHIADAMVKVEAMCQDQDGNQIAEIGPLAHECAVQCCRIGYIRLTSVFVALSALAVDYRLLCESPAEFLKALHQSCAIHFEEDFVNDTEMKLPGNIGKMESDGDVEANKVAVEFVEYLKARFRSDIVYCVAVARGVCELNVDTRDLSTRGMPQGLRDAHKIVPKTAAEITAERKNDGGEKFDLGKEPSLTTSRTNEKKGGLGTAAFKAKSTTEDVAGDHTSEMVPMGASVYH